MNRSENKTVQLSRDFVYRTKTGVGTDGSIKQLRELTVEQLKTTLQTENERKAFWINVYNGFAQELLKNNPGQYKRRSRFFQQKSIHVAGVRLSQDAIEHGILRRSKLKWSLGYLNDWFPSKIEKALRVAAVDYRIHFALNCGARSCPPIAFYRPETLDAQLETATRAYLESEAAYEELKNFVRLPATMRWFRADFGGKRGIKNILKKHAIIPQGSNPKIRFKNWDWTLTLNNYKTDDQ
jgi:hypothetical protein